MSGSLLRLCCAASPSSPGQQEGPRTPKAFAILFHALKRRSGYPPLLFTSKGLIRNTACNRPRQVIFSGWLSAWRLTSRRYLASQIIKKIIAIGRFIPAWRDYVLGVNVTSTVLRTELHMIGIGAEFPIKFPRKPMSKYLVEPARCTAS